MDIYNISGTAILQNIPLLQASEAVEELMRSDYVQPQWNSDSDDIIPAGAYVVYNGEHYSLLEPYKPEQKSEVEWIYKPIFASAFYGLSKTPFFLYTTSGNVTTKEAEWTLTDNPANFMSVLCAAILTESGLKYTYAVDNNLQISSATCAFNCTDIVSACSQIANAFETELWLEKFSTPDSSGNIGCLHLGKAQYGTAKTLEVGVNIQVPSVTKNGEYFNRFYIFGSSRNITQDYQGANVNSLATKRLTLDPTDYPNGYMDFSNGGPVYSKVLQFDDIYPSASDLVVMNIRARMRYTLDETTSEKVVIGTDPDTGDPVYDMYAVWYVQLKRKINDSYVDFTFNNTTYDKTTNPDGNLLPGLVPSFHFNSGALNGREFEIIYHSTASTVKDAADASAFSILAGDFEIKYLQEGSLIIPSVTGLTPQTDDKVVLFNVHMPSAYTDDAYDRLEAAALEEINNSYLNTTTGAAVDKNSYQAASDPTVFYTTDPGLKIGSAVTYINGTYEKSSRVTALKKRLDLPCYQTITFGDDIVKGNIEELKEDAVSANRNIDLLAELNKATSEITAAYERTHQLVLQQLSDETAFWRKAEVTVEGVTRLTAKLNPMYAGAWAEGWIAAGGVGSGGGGGGGDVSYLNDLEDVSASNPSSGDLLSYNGSAWVNIPQSSITPDLSGYVPTTRTVNGHALSSNVTVTASDVGLGNVENTALSTWTGSGNITTVGTISSGTWSGTAIGVTKGGTGLTSINKGAILYASANNTIAARSANGTSTKKYLAQTSNNAPVWEELPDLSSTYLSLANGGTVSGNVVFEGGLMGQISSGTTRYWTIDDDGSAAFDNISASMIGVNSLSVNGTSITPTNYVTLDGTQTITGAKTFSTNNITLTSVNIVPTTDDTCSLGTSGSSGKRFNAGYIRNIYTSYLQFQDGSTKERTGNIGFGSGYVELDIAKTGGDDKYVFYNSSNGFLYLGGGVPLGNSSNRWSNVYSVDGNYSGALSVTGNGTFSGNLSVAGTVTVNNTNVIDLSGSGTSLFNYGGRTSRSFNGYGTGFTFYVKDANDTQKNLFAIDGGSSPLIRVGSSIIPNYTSGFNLGGNASNQRWSTIYGVNADLSTALSVPTINIGSAVISYDSTNHALHVSGTETVSNESVTVGFYCDGWVASAGVGSSGTIAITVDSAFSSSSENPVQNKVIYAAIGDIETLLAAL